METSNEKKDVPLDAKLSPGEKVLALFSLAGIVGLFLVWWQINLAVQAVDSRAQIHLSNGIQELTRVFVDKPHLWPYFEEGKVASSEDEHRYEVLALTDMHIDFIDSLWTRSDNIKDLSSPQNEWSAWDGWIADLVKNAPSVCVRFGSTHHWYSKSLTEYMKAHCENSIANKAFQRTPKTSRNAADAFGIVSQHSAARSAPLN